MSLSGELLMAVRGFDIFGESMISIVSDEASMTGHLGRSGRCGTTVLSSRRERRKGIVKVGAANI